MLILEVPAIPPSSMDGLAAEKKNNERSRIASQAKCVKIGR